MSQIVVVDCQNDFISGSLACGNADNAVEFIKEYVNSNSDVELFYTADFHPKSHMSFEENGGAWPVHCVENTNGSELSKVFDGILNERLVPNVDNVFLKGRDKDLEEYSAIAAINNKGVKMLELLGDEVIVVGIASEFCVRETVLDLLKEGKRVTVFKDALGYVNKENHIANLDELEKMGVKIIWMCL